MQDTHLKWMLAVLIALLILTCFLFFYPPAGEPTASPHPEYSPILQTTGPYNAVSSWVGVLYGLLLISLMALANAIGLFRKGAKSSLNKWINVGIVVFCIVWVLVKIADDVYLEDASPMFIGGFPVPTALLVYGIGIFPVVMIPLYYFYFEEDIFNDDDQKTFDALMQANADKTGGEA